MGREVKRVALDFDYPLNKVWAGFCNPFYWIDSLELTDEVREKYGELFHEFEPPVGEGWQMWETVSEGSPISPVFKTPEELAHWLTDNKASAFGSMTATYEQWLSAIKRGYSVSAVMENGKFMSGVEAMSEKK